MGNSVHRSPKLFSGMPYGISYKREKHQFEKRRNLEKGITQQLIP